MVRVFHVSQSPLTIGQVLEPGQWGRSTRRFGKHGQPLADVRDAFTLIWETALETARSEIAPEAPSRLACVFACGSLPDAVAYRDRFRVGGLIHEVETNGSPPIRAADYDLITSSGDASFIGHIAERARRYWTDKPTGMPELLIGGSVTVIGVAMVDT